MNCHLKLVAIFVAKLFLVAVIKKHRHNGKVNKRTTRRNCKNSL